MSEVLDVSPDSLASHRKSVENHELKVKLLSDPDYKSHGSLWCLVSRAACKYRDLLCPHSACQNSGVGSYAIAHGQNVIQS